MAENKSPLPRTGIITRLLRGPRLCETGLRMVPSKVLEVRERLGMAWADWDRKAGLGRQGECVRGVLHGMER